jgi:polyisoprenoid-binding protein YceI
VIWVLILAACSGGASQAIGTTALLNTGNENLSQATTGSLDTTSSSSGEALTGTVVYEIVPEETTVTYEVGETLLNEGNVIKQAVGTTQGVTGEIPVDFDQPQSTKIGALTADVSSLTSDSSRRDSAIRDRFLESAQYPTVTFVPTSVVGLPETSDPGVDYPVTLHGDLTIRETTQPAVFEAVVRMEDNTIVGQATTTFLMSDFGFGPISIMGMLNTEDEVKITVDFVARPQG